MKKKFFGMTDIEVSPLGLGTVKFGRNAGVYYPAAFHLPSDDDILKLLEYAQSVGINLLDTAPAYGFSEERLGKVLKHHRHDWILSTKVGEEFVNGQSHFDFSEIAVRKSIERSLKRLNTDVIDIVFVHSNGEDKKIIEEDSIFFILEDIKKAGLIRAYGMSTKTIEGGKLAVDHSDGVMVTYNPIKPEEQIVIRYAQQKNKGVFIKKGLASGHLEKISGDNPVLTAMQFIFREPGVSSLIIGTLNKEHLQQNVMCFQKCF